MAAKRKPAKEPPRPLTQKAFFRELAGASGLTQEQLEKLFEALGKIIKRQLGKKGPGQLTVAGLFKVVGKRKPAVRARKGINPFTGQLQSFPGRPARTVVKLRPLKKLKDLVG